MENTHTGVNRAKLAFRAHQGHQDHQGSPDHLVCLDLPDQRETQASRGTMEGREKGACQGCPANMEPRGLLELLWLE